jgi:transglutaminase-like putative cysteine protease
MRLDVRYTTGYTYSQPARRVIQLLRLTPQSFPGQHVLDWRVDVDRDAKLREHRDGYGNVVDMLYVDQPVERLTVEVSGRVLTEDRAGLVDGVPGCLPPDIFLRSTPLTGMSDSLATLAHALDRHGAAPLDKLHQLNERLHLRMRFDAEATGVGTSAAEAFDAGHGVCQDYAHIFIAVARALGTPARYVSGHLFRRDGAERQPATHAWVEAHVPELGWVAFDPTNGICTDDAYVRVACGLDYRDAAPVAGARSGGGAEDLAVEVSVSETQQQAQHQSQS